MSVEPSLTTMNKLKWVPVNFLYCPRYVVGWQLNFCENVKQKQNFSCTLISESETCGRGVDGRIRRIRLPASAWVPPPVSRRHDSPKGAEKPPQLQELQVVHGRGGLGSAQTLPTGGATRCCVGRGTVISYFTRSTGLQWKNTILFYLVTCNTKSKFKTSGVKISGKEQEGIREEKQYVERVLWVFLSIKSGGVETVTSWVQDNTPC